MGQVIPVLFPLLIRSAKNSIKVTFIQNQATYLSSIFNFFSYFLVTWLSDYLINCSLFSFQYSQFTKHKEFLYNPGNLSSKVGFYPKRRFHGYPTQ